MNTTDALGREALVHVVDRTAILRVVTERGEQTAPLVDLGGEPPPTTAIDYVGIVVSSGDGHQPGPRERAARGLFNQAVQFGVRGRGEDAVAAYAEIVARFAEVTEPGLDPLIATALIFKGVTLGVLGRDDEAIAAYDEVVLRFAHASDPALRVRVATARQYRLRKTAGNHR